MVIGGWTFEGSMLSMKLRVGVSSPFSSSSFLPSVPHSHKISGLAQPGQMFGLVVGSMPISFLSIVIYQSWVSPTKEEETIKNVMTLNQSN